MSPKTFVADAVIFNMDGTLTDSAAAVNAAWDKVATDLGLDPDYVLATAHGKRAIDTLKLLKPNLTHHELDAEVEIFDKMILDFADAFHMARFGGTSSRNASENPYVEVAKKSSESRLNNRRTVPRILLNGLPLDYEDVSVVPRILLNGYAMEDDSDTDDDNYIFGRASASSSYDTASSSYSFSSESFSSASSTSSSSSSSSSTPSKRPSSTPPKRPSFASRLRARLTRERLMSKCPSFTFASMSVSASASASTTNLDFFNFDYNEDMSRTSSATPIPVPGLAVSESNESDTDLEREESRSEMMRTHSNWQEAWKIEAAAVDRSVRILPGVRRMMDSIPKGRYAVATGGAKTYAYGAMIRVGITPPAVTITADDKRLKSSKPSPDPFLLAADCLGFPATNCVVFEDSPAGIRAGVAAGATVVALCTSHKREDIEGCGAHYVVPDMESVRCTVERTEEGDVIRLEFSIEA